MRYLLNLFGFLFFFIYAQVLLAQSIAGNALQCSASEYLQSSLMLHTTKGLTIETWIHPESYPQFAFPIYVGKDTTEGYGFVIQTNLVTGEAYLSIMLGGIKLSVTGNGARLPLNVWSHIALTRGDSIWNLYKNGALIGRGKLDPLPPTVRIMYGKSFVGKLDEIRIWNHELSGDEIRNTMATPLLGSEKGLIVYYPMNQDSVLDNLLLVNKASGMPGYDAVRNDGGNIILTSSTAPILLSIPPRHTLIHFPMHMQFFARDENSNAGLNFDGSIDEDGYDSIIVEQFKEDYFAKRIAAKLHYAGGKAQFHLTDTIHAELVRSTYRLHVKKRDTLIFLAEAADLVAGDVFLIDGQSNAHPTNDGFYWQNPFARSFGIQTLNENFDTYDPADTLWGLSSASGWGESWSGPYLSGAWAQWMEQRIVETFAIPVCIINGAAGGSIITEHLRNDLNRTDLSSVYGRLLYRTLKSGLENSVRAIFWYQGEYDHHDGYYDNFKLLDGAWREDYHYQGLAPRTYLMQIHPGCFIGDGKLREIQRELPDSLPGITLMSSNGVAGHDVCHYFWYGYVDIGEKFFRLVGRDFYGSSDTIDIYPPNIKKASYGNSIGDVIILQFSNVGNLALTPDTLISGKPRKLKNYFYLDSVSGKVSNLFIRGDSLILQLSSPSKVKFITYLPDRTYDDDTLVYEGPWILNSRGVGALSFYDVPIEPYRPDTTTSDTEEQFTHQTTLQCFPNPATINLTVIYTLPRANQVTFEVMNILGNTVLPLGKRNAGVGENFGFFDLSPLSDGEYFLRMTAGSDIFTQKFILFK